MPKLLFAVHPPLSIQGGVSLLAQSLIEHFSKHFDVYLLSCDQPDAIPHHKIHSYLSGHIYSPNPQRLRYVAQNKAIAAKIKTLGIDLVHFHSGFYCWGNLIYGCSLPRHLRKVGIPSVWTMHGGLMLLEGYCDPKLPSLLKALLFVPAWLGKLNQLRNVRHEVHVSESSFSLLKKWWFPHAAKCLHFYHSRLEPKSLSDCHRSQVILNVGYVSFLKRQDLLVKAFLMIADRYPDYEVHLAGHIVPDGSKSEIDRLIASSRSGGRIRFLGDRSDANDLMRTCSIYAQCSDLEGLPLALQEAMFHCCPVIASDIPAHRELVDSPENGILFEKGNAADLAKKLDHLLSNPELRNQMGENASSSIIKRQMTKAAMLASYSALYNKVLNA